MMKSTVSAFVLMGFVAAASATMCFVCTGTAGSCMDEFAGGDTDLVNCSTTLLGVLPYTEDGGCSKLKTKTKVLGIEVITVTRTCGQDYDNSQCPHANRENTEVLGIKHEAWKCSCKGDKCNSGAQMAASFSILGGVVALLLA